MRFGVEDAQPTSNCLHHCRPNPPSPRACVQTARMRANPLRPSRARPAPCCPLAQARPRRPRRWGRGRARAGRLAAVDPRQIPSSENNRDAGRHRRRGGCSGGGAARAVHPAPLALPPRGRVSRSIAAHSAVGWPAFSLGRIRVVCGIVTGGAGVCSRTRCHTDRSPPALVAKTTGQLVFAT